MNLSTPGLPVHHQLPELTQTHVHWVSDAIQPSHPLLSPSPPAPNPSQHQSLFQWVTSLQPRQISIQVSCSLEHTSLLYTEGGKQTIQEREREKHKRKSKAIDNSSMKTKSTEEETKAFLSFLSPLQTISLSSFLMVPCSPCIHLPSSFPLPLSLAHLPSSQFRSSFLV